MISRHYWPHFAVDAACRDARLADALARSGMAIEVLTPRYAASWPDVMTHREITVHRPVAAPRGAWSVGRYLKLMEAWLTENAARFDVLFCTQCDDDIIPMVRAAAQKSLRRVALHSGTGLAADHMVWPATRNGRRIRASLDRVDAIVVSWPSVHRQMLATGLAAKKLHRIDIGVPPFAAGAHRDDPAANHDSLRRSRAALSHVNGDLMLHHDSHVILACGQMNSVGGMMTLAATVPPLIDIWPDLRFWLVGDGGRREELHGYFRQHSVRQNVAMPGTFVDFDDLFQVADLLVVPSGSDSLEAILPAAVGAGLPILVADSPDTRSFFAGAEDSVGWFPVDDAEGLRSAIRAALIDLPARRVAARTLRRRWMQQRPYQSTVEAYKQLFESLVPPAQRLSLPPIDSAAKRPN
jgi:glycosyltransferase involved in cell wall biosynthesis